MYSVFSGKYNISMTNPKSIVMGCKMLLLADSTDLGWYIGIHLEGKVDCRAFD